MEFPELKVRHLGSRSYEESLSDMQSFVQSVDDTTTSEIWLVEHPPVYTLGTACSLSTLIQTDIPTVKTDRGGQITYHGPGQIIMYPLIKLKDFKLGVKGLVDALEQSAINTLAEYGLQSVRRDGAPGVYIDEKKISALGLRVKRGWSYHGLSLNVAMDLSPFSNIDPCGYKGMEVAQLSDYVEDVSFTEVTTVLLEQFTALLKESHTASE